MMATTGGGGDQLQQRRRGWFDEAFSDPEQKSSGMRFNPHDEELIAHLRKRTAGVALPCDFDSAIPTVGLYGLEGNDPRSLFQNVPIFSSYPLVHSEHEFYVFANLEPCNAGSHHIRVAGEGTWSLNNKRSIVDARGRTLGKMSHLTFLVPADEAEDGGSGGRTRSKGDAGGRRSKGVTTHWVMHEYSLPDDEKEGQIEGSSKKKRGGKVAPPPLQQHQETSSGRLVLCRIRYTLEVKGRCGGGGGVGEVAGGGDDASEGPLVLHPRKRWVGSGVPEGAEDEQRAHPVACAFLTHDVMAQHTAPPHAMRCHVQEDDQDHQPPVITDGEGGSIVGDVVLVAESSVTQDVMAAQHNSPPHAAMPVRAQQADQDHQLETMHGEPATDGDRHTTTAVGDEPADMFDGLDDLLIDWDCLPCINPEHSYTDAVLPAGDDPGCCSLITQQPPERRCDDAVLAAGEDPGFVDDAALTAGDGPSCCAPDPVCAAAPGCSLDPFLDGASTAGDDPRFSAPAGDGDHGGYWWEPFGVRDRHDCYGREDLVLSPLWSSYTYAV